MFHCHDLDPVQTTLRYQKPNFATIFRLSAAASGLYSSMELVTQLSKFIEYRSVDWVQCLFLTNFDM